jgi:hypothetical protein
MVQPSDDRSSLGFVSIDNTPKPSQKVVEGYSSGDYLRLFKSMVSSDNGGNFNPAVQRKYGMTRNVEDYPSTHPEYSPDASEKAYNDSQKLLNHPYANLSMIFATTAALGLIAIMVTAGSSAPSSAP